MSETKAIKELLKRPIAYHGILAKAFRSVPAAVMVSQALYWQDKATAAGNEWFYITAEEWYDQTGVTPESQHTARKMLKAFGFWEEKRIGIPARMHYRIDLDALVAVIYRYLETGNPLSGDNRNKKREFTRTSSGKFRQLDTVKNRNSYKNKEKTTKITERDARAKNEDHFSEQDKKTSPPIPADPPSAETIIRAEGPDDLLAGLQSMYASRREDWQAVEERLQQAAYRAGQPEYSKEDIREVMLRYCEHAITKGLTFWSFARHNARLRTWMSDEPVLHPRKNNNQNRKNEGPKLDFGTAAAARAIESAERLAREIDSGNYF